MRWVDVGGNTVLSIDSLAIKELSGVQVSFYFLKNNKIINLPSKWKKIITVDQNIFVCFFKTY